jgi:hypothetical protein
MGITGPKRTQAKGDRVAMFKARAAIAVLLGMAALGAVSASSASAGWYIEGE